MGKMLKRCFGIKVVCRVSLIWFVAGLGLVAAPVKMVSAASGFREYRAQGLLMRPNVRWRAMNQWLNAVNGEVLRSLAAGGDTSYTRYVLLGTHVEDIAAYNNLRGDLKDGFDEVCTIFEDSDKIAASNQALLSIARAIFVREIDPQISEQASKEFVRNSGLSDFDSGAAISLCEQVQLVEANDATESHKYIHFQRLRYGAADVIFRTITQWR